MWLSLYMMGGFFLLLSGFGLIFLGVYFSINDYVFFMDWEFMSLLGCNMVMTLLFDYMSMIFIGCVFLISSMVIYYSEVYMKDDLMSVRFYLLVLLFVLSMMFMIISPNLISILIGWDGLGLVSYCLVIYFQNYKSYSAGMLTILTNRIGDVGILLGIAWFLNFGSWHYMFYIYVWEDTWMYLFMFLIILAGFTSSAQIPFSSWLPAAMAAPTPVSSLVHSSTLVTAGVYLLIRFSDFLISLNCSFILMLSMITMFMAGLGANFEYDLKSIIALSTLSQLGLMMSILLLGFPLLSFFHLLSHAFFKALLFLCAGLMIHCMGDSQDVRHMGMMINQLPFTCSCFCVSNLSLCGIPFLSGFYSKDVILELMTSDCNNFLVFLVFFMSVGLTAMYSMRLIYYCLIFNVNNYVIQSFKEDKLMVSSMVLLTCMSVLGGSLLSWLLFFVPNIVFFSLVLKLLPLVFVFLGFWVGYELSFINLTESLFSVKSYFMTFYMGCMWFMPFFSTSMNYSYALSMSKFFTESMDSGWGEYFISNSSLSVSSMLSGVYGFYHYNNIKIFMMVYILILLVLMI
uniref:NADH-ubiquinone oxidoreductase chain 5 n=1 Tax=Physoderes impexa TaxID=1239050 RepID=A0A7I6HH36_9HEMI|nr:NADH dehydrogenase subunit 5 [Physoderes impexa]AGO28085.1 NADH dehydrogenase subunit 5 [Physoderes impexa]